jgi:transposase
MSPKYTPPQRHEVTDEQRNLVEQLFNRLKQFRRMATRYEKLGQNYEAMLTLAAILL